MDGLGNLLLGVAAVITAIGGIVIGWLKVGRDVANMRKWLNAKVRQANGVPIAYIESLPFPGWIKDDEGRYVFINQEFARMHDCRLVDFEGRNDFELWDGESALAFQKSDREVMIDRKRIEFTQMRPNKSGFKADFKYPARVAKWPIFGEQGKVVGVGGICIPDVSDASDLDRKSEPAIPTKSLRRTMSDTGKVKDESKSN